MGKIPSWEGCISTPNVRTGMLRVRVSVRVAGPV
jgi:hypothetical protein